MGQFYFGDPAAKRVRITSALTVMGWSMHHRQDRHMVVRAVQMAVWQRSVSGVNYLDRSATIILAGVKGFGSVTSSS